MKEIISSKQFFKIIIVYIIANDLTRGIYVKDLKQDIWVANVIGTLISVLFFTLYMYIYKNNKFDNYNNSIKHITGKIISKILYMFYILYFCAIAVLNIFDILEVITFHLLPNYSYTVISLIIVLTIGYILFKKIEVVARLSELLFIAIVFIFIAMCFLTLSLRQITVSNILPILADGAKILIKPSIEMGYSVPYGELFVLLIIFQYIEKKEKSTHIGNLAILTSGFILVIITILNIFIIGTYAMGYGISPAIRLARMIHIEEYIQRLDMLLIMFHMLLIIVKCVVLIYGAGHLLQSIFNFKEKQLKVSYVVMLLVIFIAIEIFFKNYTNILLFRRNFFTKYVGLIMEIFIPLVLVLVSFIKKNKKKVNPKAVVEFDI